MQIALITLIGMDLLLTWWLTSKYTIQPLTKFKLNEILSLTLNLCKVLIEITSFLSTMYWLK